jgi:hypothetical protein
MGRRMTGAMGKKSAAQIGSRPSGAGTAVAASLAPGRGLGGPGKSGGLHEAQLLTALGAEDREQGDLLDMGDGAAGATRPPRRGHEWP